MKYSLNIDYIKKEVKNANFELFNTIINYEGILPNALYDVFNPNINFLELNIPVEIKQAIMAKHEVNFIEHRRFEAFKKPNESFEDCDKRLIQELVDKTGLPIFE